MPGYNKSIYAFEDIKDAFDQAMASTKGIKIECKNNGEAIGLRSRFNYFRKLNRADNAKIYDPDLPLHKASIYDKLLLRIPAKGQPDDNFLYIEHRSVTDMRISEI